MTTINGEMFLSKVVTENDVKALSRHGLYASHFQTNIEKRAYEFILDFARSNEGNAPSYATLIDAVPEFDYYPDATDSFTFYGKQLKTSKYQNEMAEFFNGDSSQFAKAWAEYSKEPEKFYQVVSKQMEELNRANSISDKIGTDVAKSGEWFMEELENRKQGKGHKLWKSGFNKLDDILGGGFQSSNMFTTYAKSGRGKSILTMVFLLEAAMNGATVLVWTLEMSKYEFISRLLSFLSARDKIVTHEMEGRDPIEAGFKVNEMLTGKFENYETEHDLIRYLENLNDTLKGKIIVRAIDDEDFNQRSVSELERNIEEFEADVVLVDPIYYLTMEKNTSKTAGGDLAETSKRLRKVAGRHRVVLHVITQASEDESEETGSDREIKLPKRSAVKKTKQVLEDSTAVIAFDSADGRFQIGVNKGRSGGEGEVVEGIFLPAIGYVKETNNEAIQDLFASPSGTIDF